MFYVKSLIRISLEDYLKIIFAMNYFFIKNIKKNLLLCT